MSVNRLAGIVAMIGMVFGGSSSAFADDIVDTAVKAGTFKTLAAAAGAADLVATLKGKGPLTVFAPTNTAFAALLTELGVTKDQLLANKPLLTAVLQAVKNVNGNAGFVSGYPTRKSYATFGYISPESFVDTNGNGKRDAGECYTDVNGNSTWDADPGVSGNGGAGDTVLYTASITYTRLFPMSIWMGWSRTATLSASTVLKNQPWAAQASSTPATVCT